MPARRAAPYKKKWPKDYKKGFRTTHKVTCKLKAAFKGENICRPFFYCYDDHSLE